MKKSILVTGASSGIGRAATELFARRGFQVFARYRKSEDGEALAAIDNVHPLQMDVTSTADVARAVSDVAGRLGDDGLFAILNNAGVGYAAPFECADEERGREVMEVNVMAPFRIAQKFLPLLLDHYATLSVDYGSSPWFATGEQVAQKLLRIVETKRPGFQYDLAADACFVNKFLARFVPWGLKVAMNRSMFRLSAGKASVLRGAGAAVQ